MATNDCHYSMEDHWEAHDVLFCLGTDKIRSDTNRIRYEPKQFYIKSVDEMVKLFPEAPKAIENTIKLKPHHKAKENVIRIINKLKKHLDSLPAPASSA